MATEERPSIGERYGAATESSNLKLSERRGDLDLIIAAGMASSRLGSTLHRLQIEYDAVRADHAAADRRMRELEERARAQTGERAKETRDQAEAEALTAHVLILAHLGTLQDAKVMFGEFATLEATRQQVWKTDREVAAIAGRVLECWLAPNCRHCDGRGFNGGGRHEQTGVQVLCRPCRGSGHRRDSIGKDGMERLFAGHLLACIDSMINEVDKQIASGLRTVDNRKRWLEEQVKPNQEKEG